MRKCQNSLLNLHFGIYDLLTIMTKKVRLFFILAFISLFAQCAFSSIPSSLGLGTTSDNPVKWRVEAKMTSSHEGIVTIVASIASGWHLYGTELPEDGPLPTTFDFSQSKGIVFTDDLVPSEAAIAHQDANFDLTLDWWSGRVTFTRHFRLMKQDINDATIGGSIKYMSCNDKTCMPPKTQTFKITPKPFTQAK